MQNYDVTLKSLLHRALAGSVLADWAGVTVTRWHNTELPSVSSRRVDLLGDDADGVLTHIELQSWNDPEMPSRMGEYGFGIYRKFGRFPRQLVLYFGREPMKMSAAFEAPGISLRYRIVDIREIDAEVLMASARLEDNILAILAGGMAGAPGGGFRELHLLAARILRRIAESPDEERGRAFSELTFWLVFDLRQRS